MINKTLRRLAVGASAITVLGVVVPLAAATSASAAEATGITATPASQTVAPGGTATYQATLTPAGSTSANGVNSVITAGPGVTTPIQNTACTPAGGANVTGPFTCTQTGPATAGTYTVTIYDNTANMTTLQPSDPQTTVQLIVSGTATATTITPATAKAATSTCQAYTVSSKDANGNAAAGQTVTVTESQTVPTTSAPPGNRFCDPAVKTFPATALSSETGPVDTPSGTNSTYTYSNTYTLSSGATGQPPAGSVVIGVFSTTPGTVNIMAGTNSITTTGQAATLTVDAGNTNQDGVNSATQTGNNDNAATLTLSPKTNSATTSGTATETATVKNSAGDLLGGVQVSAQVTGGTGASATCPGTTDQTGTVTCTVTAGSTSGTETLTAFVNQDTHNPNTNGPDAGEPQDTATITVGAALTTPVLTNSCTGTPPSGSGQTGGTCSAAASAASQNVTFTLTSSDGTNGTSAPAAGKTVTFTSTSTNSNDYTLSAPGGTVATNGTLTATTDANGRIVVTVTHPANTAENGTVTGTFNGGSGNGSATSTANVNFVTPAATTLTITPRAQTKTVGSTVTETITVTDQLGNPVPNKVVNYSTSGRNAATAGANGTCTTDSKGQCTITYTDAGPALTGQNNSGNQAARTDTTTATVVGVAGATGMATVTFVAGNAQAATVVLTASNGGTASTAPAGSPPSASVTATVKDSNGNLLQNDTVTFTSTGVGGFVDAQGNSLGTTTTTATNSTGQATVGVSSTTAGQEFVNSSADGVNSNQVTITYGTTGFTAITPVRIVDTRSGQGGLNSGPLTAGQAYTFSLSGSPLPTGQSAYVFNLTAVQTSGGGNLSITPSCGTQSQTSVVNYQPGKTVANDVIVQNPVTTAATLNTPATYCDSFTVISRGSSANVVIDAQGYYAQGSSFTGVTPTRVADTRVGTNGVSGPIGAGQVKAFQISGNGAVPNDGTAKSVAINVTAINPIGVGNAQVYADGATPPQTSNINYIPGVDKAAFVVVNLPANGKIDIKSRGSSADFAIDVFGYYISATNPMTITPTRVFDSRSSTLNQGATSPLAAGTPYNVTVTGGTTGVPATAQAVLISLTAAHTAGGAGVGNLEAYPAGGSRPVVSNVNYVGPIDDVANFAIVKVGTNGQITLQSNGSPINAIVDVLGYVPAS